MTITYEEIKHRLTDLGFEEDDVADSDYARIYVNSLNRAGEIIYHTVMLQIPDYIKKTENPSLTAEDIEIPFTDEGEVKAITRITEETADEDELYVPKCCLPLWTLLAAHYAWLDDDLTKATIYWNEYDDLKNQVMQTAMKPRNAEIIGGIGW